MFGKTSRTASAFSFYGQLTIQCQVTGTSLYTEWFAPYIVSFAAAQSAIIVSPNYRLLPESKGSDILDDISDFWVWVQQSLLSFVASRSTVPLTVDFNHILVCGESAGGQLALLSAFMLPEGFINAVLAQYPITDRRTEIARAKKTKMIFGMPVPEEDFVDKFVARIRPGAVVSGAAPPARLDLMFTMAVYGKLCDFLGHEPKFYPIEAIETAAHFPSMWLLHGRDDEIIPVESSVAFVEKVRELFPDTKVKLTVEDGNHGFDGEKSVDKDPWLKEGVEWLVKEWLKN